MAPNQAPGDEHESASDAIVAVHVIAQGPPAPQAGSGPLLEASGGPTLDRPVMHHALVPVSTLVAWSGG